MDLTPLVQHLENEGLGTIGQDLFRNNMPASVNEGLVVVTQMPIIIDSYLGTCKGSFQIIARASDYDTPRLKMTEVMIAMNGQGAIHGDMLFHFIKARNEPMIFPKSEGDQIEASVNFDFVYSLIC